MIFCYSKTEKKSLSLPFTRRIFFQSKFISKKLTLQGKTDRGRREKRRTNSVRSLEQPWPGERWFMEKKIIEDFNKFN